MTIKEQIIEDIKEIDDVKEILVTSETKKELYFNNELERDYENHVPNYYFHGMPIVLDRSLNVPFRIVYKHEV